MRSQRHLWIGGAFVALIVALGIGQLVVERAVNAQAKSGTQAPRFEVDPMWPKPLPNHWLLGSTIGVSVDAQDHVWIIHRSSATLNNNERGAELDPPTGECCKGAGEGLRAPLWKYEIPKSLRRLALRGGRDLNPRPPA